jgi:hypothetical protein
MDILFSFLRFQLKWTDREYGLFNGFGTGLASFCVFFFSLRIFKHFLTTSPVFTHLPGDLFLPIASKARRYQQSQLGPFRINYQNS